MACSLHDLVCLYTWSRVSDSEVWSCSIYACVSTAMHRLLCIDSIITYWLGSCITIASQFDNWQFILIIHFWRQTKLRHFIHIYTWNEMVPTPLCTWSFPLVGLSICIYIHLTAATAQRCATHSIPLWLLCTYFSLNSGHSVFSQYA